MNCGMGSVDSGVSLAGLNGPIDKAMNPSASMYLLSASSDYAHHWNRPSPSCNILSTTIRPARNSRYVPNLAHCQKASGRDDVLPSSGA